MTLKAVSVLVHARQRSMCSFIEFLSRTLQEIVFVATLVTRQQFPHSPNLFHGYGAHGVWPRKNFHLMLLWPLRVLSRVMFDQHKDYHSFYI